MTDATCHYLEPGDRSQEVLDAHLPTGLAWEMFRRPGTVAWRLLWALGQAFEDAWEALCRLSTELDPRTTTDMITEWETALGLPDPCLPEASTLEERRAWVMWRLDKRRWTTAQDWHDLAALYGLTITITPGWLVQKPSLYPSCYPIYYRNLPKLGRFRVYIDIEGGCDGNGYIYDYAATYPATVNACSEFQCMIERIRPANVVVIWNNTPPISC